MGSKILRSIHIYFCHFVFSQYFFNSMTGSSNILETSFLVFCHLGCVIFCTMFTVAKQDGLDKLLCNILVALLQKKHNQKWSYQNRMKRSLLKFKSNIRIDFKTLILTCSSSVEESCRCDPVEGTRFIGFSCCWLLPKLLVICLGGGLGGTGLPEKHSDMWM